MGNTWTFRHLPHTGLFSNCFTAIDPPLSNCCMHFSQPPPPYAWLYLHFIPPPSLYRLRTHTDLDSLRTFRFTWSSVIVCCMYKLCSVLFPFTEIRNSTHSLQCKLVLASFLLITSAVRTPPYPRSTTVERKNSLGGDSPIVCSALS